jgi:hypothetical protein
MTGDGWKHYSDLPTPLANAPHDAVRSVAVLRHEDRGLIAIRSYDNISYGTPNPPDWRWHISVRNARDGRVPTWDELAFTGHSIRPGVAFALGVPPRSWWINVHEHVLHLWQLKDDALLEQWRSEAQGHTPT